MPAASPTAAYRPHRKEESDKPLVMDPMGHRAETRKAPPYPLVSTDPVIALAGRRAGTMDAALDDRFFYSTSFRQRPHQRARK